MQLTLGSGAQMAQYFDLQPAPPADVVSPALDLLAPGGSLDGGDVRSRAQQPRVAAAVVALLNFVSDCLPF